MWERKINSQDPQELTSCPQAVSAGIDHNLHQRVTSLAGRTAPCGCRVVLQNIIKASAQRPPGQRMDYVIRYADDESIFN
ncbi:unnamed protein product [Lota lota]